MNDSYWIDNITLEFGEAGYTSIDEALDYAILSGLRLDYEDDNDPVSCIIWDAIHGHPVRLVLNGRVYEIISDDDGVQDDEDDESEGE